MNTKRVFSEEQITQRLGEQKERIEEVLDVAYGFVELIGTATEAYVTAASAKLQQAQHFGHVDEWANETEAFLQAKAKEFRDVTQGLIEATKDLQK